MTPYRLPVQAEMYLPEALGISGAPESSRSMAGRLRLTHEPPGFQALQSPGKVVRVDQHMSSGCGVKALAYAAKTREGDNAMHAPIWGRLCQSKQGGVVCEPTITLFIGVAAAGLPADPNGGVYPRNAAGNHYSFYLGSFMFHCAECGSLGNLAALLVLR